MKKNAEEIKFRQKLLNVTVSSSLFLWFVAVLWVDKRIEADWVGLGSLILGSILFVFSLLINKLLDDMRKTPEIGDKVIIKSTKEIAVVTDIKNSYFIVNNFALTLSDFDLLENKI